MRWTFPHFFNSVGYPTDVPTYLDRSPFSERWYYMFGQDFLGYFFFPSPPPLHPAHPFEWAVFYHRVAFWYPKRVSDNAIIPLRTNLFVQSPSKILLTQVDPDRFELCVT